MIYNLVDVYTIDENQGSCSADEANDTTDGRSGIKSSYYVLYQFRSLMTNVAKLHHNTPAHKNI